jgi:hypothetical protein
VTQQYGLGADSSIHRPSFVVVGAQHDLQESQDPEAQVLHVPGPYAPVHEVDVGPEPSARAFAEVELDEPEHLGGVVPFIVGSLPAPGGLEDRQGAVEEPVGLVIVPSLSVQLATSAPVSAV